jgi:hypothetical protein
MDTFVGARDSEEPLSGDKAKDQNGLTYFLTSSRLGDVSLQR